MSQVREFNPPANIKDFDIGSKLYKEWNSYLIDSFSENIALLITDIGLQGHEITFFDPRFIPAGDQLTQSVPWNGFPKALAIRHNKPEAYRLSDKLATFGFKDDLGSTRAAKYSDIEGRKPLLWNYRQQDEYLEWAVFKDEVTGKIKEIIFTCEGPEYWEILSKDPQLLLRLYEKYTNNSIDQNDLYLEHNVYEVDENGNIVPDPVYKKGDYNRYNKWNMKYAIHLSHPSNTLGAEINLAAFSSVIRKNKDDIIITDASSLICCSAFGSPNRFSDPTIGGNVNSVSRNGNWVTLKDPVGLYIAEIDFSRFTKPDGSIISDFTEKYWNVLRGSEDGSMILRVSLKVPEGETYNGEQLLLGDLLVNGEPLNYGGRVAETITMKLFALAVTGGPSSMPKYCQQKCCKDLEYPNFDNIVDIKKACPILNPIQSTSNTQLEFNMDIIETSLKTRSKIDSRFNK
jgi:hypothetical protein